MFIPLGFFLCEGQFFLDFLTNALFESPCKNCSLQIIHFNSKTRHFMVKKCRIFEKCIICSDFFQHRFAMVKKTSLSRANLTKKLRFTSFFTIAPKRGGILGGDLLKTQTRVQESFFASLNGSREKNSR